MVIWLTGISGAGKSTLANEIIKLVKPTLPSLILIDGDVVRALFDAQLGYHEEARMDQIGRIQRLAYFISSQGVPVIVSALYSSPKLLQWNRDYLNDYFEVYVDTPLDVVIARDPKGLYKKAMSGSEPNVVGIDIPWQVPCCPDLVVSSVGVEPQSIARQIISKVPWLALPDPKPSD